MKKLFYPRLAFDGIRKNGRLYFPYILTCVCMIAMFYIMQYIASPECLEYLPVGKTMIPIFMATGSIVMVVFSILFLFYTNSFISRRRTKEFGLYNVLGMNKRNLARVIVWETLITAAISVAAGLFTGIVLSKFAELGLVRMFDGRITFDIKILPGPMIVTSAVYLCIFAALLVNSVIKVGTNNAINLMKSEAAGEKAPKANWLLGLLGVAVLVTAYVIAIANSTYAVAAIGAFMVAVILVIAATYMIFIAGSVLFCKILQRSKNYYYKPDHFVSVSSMTFRMKRNGAGLASICIISTMVLVMLSSSSSLWFGCEESLAAQFPREMRASVHFDDIMQVNNKIFDLFDEAVAKSVGKYGGSKNVIASKYIYTPVYLEGSVADAGYDRSVISYTSKKIRDLYVIPTEYFNSQTGENLVLSDSEALIVTDNCTYKENELTVKLEEKTLRLSVKAVKKDRDVKVRTGANDGMGRLTVVMNDPFTAFAGIADTVKSEEEQNTGVYSYRLPVTYSIDFDFGNAPESGSEAFNDMMVEVENSFYSMLGNSIRAMNGGEIVNVSFSMRSGSDSNDEMRYMYGGIFFLGIMLSLVFMLAAVLIIYYKQITEGYEDSKRFEIMQNVGMTKKEIKKAINSQLLTVFFAPLALAGLHLCFAFPIIRAILVSFELYNLGLFTVTTIASFVLFAIFYVVVYKSTSKAYYSIVSG